MHRSSVPEIIETAGLSDEVLKRAHRDLTRTHRWLGNTAAIIAALRRNPYPVRRVLDVGCGWGGVLLEVRRSLGAEIIGVDLRVPPDLPLPIICADAVRAPLPASDVAISLCLAHHLSESEVIELIRNVGRSCQRFILLDLVRHQLPLALFRMFVSPFLYRVNALDGRTSIRRAYTPQELDRLVRLALDGSGARFSHSVAPLYARQIIDISY